MAHDEAIKVLNAQLNYYRNCLCDNTNEIVIKQGYRKLIKSLQHSISVLKADKGVQK